MSEWRAIPGWEGLYQVSDQGQVRSTERVVRGKKLGRVLKPYINNHGYEKVNLCHLGSKSLESVHHRRAKGSAQSTKGVGRMIYCSAQTYRATRFEPAEFCENEVEDHGDLCADHDAEDRSDADYENYLESLRKED